MTPDTLTHMFKREGKLRKSLITVSVYMQPGKASNSPKTGTSKAPFTSMG